MKSTILTEQNRTEQNRTEQNRTERNYGIDLLRIISMIMIPVLHILGHGGILDESKTLYSHNIIAWILEIASYCAVNSYALISGFVGYGRKQKYSNIIYLYFQVLFYTVPTTIVFYIYNSESVGIETIKKAVFPFAYGTYWYFTAYFCLFFFIPFLNLVVDKFDKKTLQKLIAVTFIIFSILPTLFSNDFGKTSGGYSFLWLAILYLVGAYIKKFGISLKYKNVYNLYGYFICVLITWLSRIGIECITKKIFGEYKMGGYLISYTSPTIIFCSIFLLLFFKNIKYNKIWIKFIGYFAPVSFGVYLLHEEPLIRDAFITNVFIEYAYLNPFVMVLCVVATAVVIWFTGSMVDRLRLIIFDLLKVRQLCVFIEKKTINLLHNFQKKLRVK